MLDNPTIYVTAVTTPTFERRETTKANTSIKHQSHLAVALYLKFN